MSVEGDPTSSTFYINSLTPTYPSGDEVISQGDDHLRLIKKSLKNTFPNVTAPVTATAAELNIIDGVTATTAELNVLDGMTASTAELNILDGCTITTEELNSVVTGGYRLQSRTIYSTNGTKTYVPPTGTRALFVECYGAGGGGGGVDGQGTGTRAIAGSGGGGGYCNHLFTSALDTFDVYVGEGGDGGAAGANNGSPGDQSTFTCDSVSMYASGGGGGEGCTAAATIACNGGSGSGAGGAATVVVYGSDAGLSKVSSATTFNISMAGRGGGPLGAGGQIMSVATVNSAGTAGRSPGGGGCGAMCDNTTSNNYAGGKGGDGMIIIWEYV